MKQTLIGLAIGLLFAAIAFMAWEYTKPAPAGGPSVIATEAPAVKGAPRKKVAVKAPVEIIGGDAKKNTNLPESIQKDDNEQVVASSQNKANLRPTTTTTVLNVETGKFDTFVKTDSYPWLAYEPRGSIGLAYGFKYSHVMHASQTVGRLQADYELVRVKAFKLGLTGSVDSDSTAFVGVGVKYQW